MSAGRPPAGTIHTVLPTATSSDKLLPLFNRYKDDWGVVGLLRRLRGRLLSSRRLGMGAFAQLLIGGEELAYEA